MAFATDNADECESPELDSQDAASEHIGRVVAGTYRIARHIGSGGSSHVFEAEHLRLGTSFAVKLLRAGLGGGRRAAQRFRREAKAVARLRSEHIVRVIDCGELDDRMPYLVMELLQGEDLRSLLRREHALPARRAVRLVLEACHGLTEVHENGLVHRDLKPENLFVSRRSTGEDWCKVLDFGVAKMESSLSTAQGAIVGTVRYMAPEQLADGDSVGPATDIYALGAILYECLSGKPLHAGDAIQEVMFNVMNRPAPSLAALPRALSEIVASCVAKEPSKRPQQAAELGRLLSAALQLGTHSGPADVTLPEAALGASEQPLLPSASRATRSRGLAVAVTLATLIGATAAWFVKPRERESSVPQPTPASPATTKLARRVPTSNESTAAGLGSLVLVPTSAAPASSMAPAPSSLARPAPKALPRVAPASSAPLPAPKGVPVSSFDPANPYGE